MRKEVKNGVKTQKGLFIRVKAFNEKKGERTFLNSFL